MDKIAKINVIVISMVILLTSITLVGAQQFIVLENERGVQKSSFIRGEGIVVTLTLPYDGMVEVWLHNPPGTPGPSPILFISRTPVDANIQTKLGPNWMDEKAPCGKYQLELRIFDLQGSLITTEYKFFDYAMNEPPCAITTVTTTTTTGGDKDIWIIAGISAVVIAVVVVLVVVFMLRPGARPPKERALVAPPIAPPTPPPSTAPKAPRRRRPIVRGEHEEEGT